MRIFNYTSIIFLLLFIFSCQYLNKKDRCEKLIEKDKMVEIMTDVYLLEAYFQENLRTRSTLRDSIHIYYAALFKEHGISKKTYDNAFECYVLDREKISYINEEIMNTLSIMQSQEQKEKMPYGPRQNPDTLAH